MNILDRFIGQKNKSSQKLIIDFRKTLFLFLKSRFIPFNALFLATIHSGCTQSKPLEYNSDIAVQLMEGQKIYLKRCAVCHKSEGQGVLKKYPPLANSDWLSKDVKSQAISSIKNGKRGPIAVNGVEYNGVMPALPLSDIEITYVLNFIYNSWGNNQTRVTLDEVKAVDENTFSGMKAEDI